MDENVSLRFEAIDAGWLTLSVVFRSPDNSRFQRSWRASCASDIIGDLIHATTFIASNGVASAQVYIVHEPDVTLWTLRRTGTDQLDVVLEHAATERDVFRFDAKLRCGVIDFAKAVINGVEAIDRATYVREWVPMEFPDEGLFKLERSVERLNE